MSVSHGKQRQRLAVPSIALAILFGLTASMVAGCGSSSEDTGGSSVAETPATPCPGKPVVVANITSLGGTNPLNEIGEGVEAAAKAINHNCEAGRPIELVTCNDEGNQSKGADCGREIVNSGAIAMVGAGGVAAQSYEPIVQGDGIISVGNLSTGPTELAAPTSFPFYSGLTRMASRCATHHALGVKSLAIVIQEVPALETILPTIEEICSKYGVEVERFVTVPSDATDLAQYASQGAESESIMLLADEQAPGLLHELINLGVTPEDTVITTSALSEDEVEEFGEQLNGLYITSPTVPLTETSNEGIAQYLAETEADDVEHLGTEGLVAWRAMHVTADVIKGQKNPTKESMKKAFDELSFAPPEAAPVDFTKPAITGVPVFTEFRVFSKEFAAWVIKGGEIQLAAPPFLDPETEFEIES